MMKKILKIAAVAVCIAAAIWILSSLLGKKKEPKMLFRTENVKRGDINSTVTATGTIEPVVEVEVGTQVSGIIDKIYVDYNSVVTKGQLIAEMDKVTLQSELESAQAAYDGSKAEYEYQKKNYERNKLLFDKKLISDSEFDTCVYDYERAKSAYDSSKATLAKAERNLSYATITSPIDGVVINKSVEAGQTVASGFETPTLFTIAADLTKMQVIADVDEADIGEVKEGQNVVFTVDAYPNDTFTGTVTQIRLGEDSESTTTSSTTSSVVTYEVVITADNPDLKLKPRLTANVTIYTMDKKDVLYVTCKAMKFNPTEYNTEATVKDCEATEKLWKKNGQEFIAIPVQTGVNNGIFTEIISGVAEGDEIVSDAIFDLSDMNIESSDSEKSPFMPGPPDDKNKKKQK